MWGIKKRYIALFVVLGFLGIKTACSQNRQPVKEIVQTWPLSTNPDGVRLRIPVGYISDNVMWFEPILEKDKPPKKPNEKTGIELFKAWWPTMQPMTQKLTYEYIKSREDKGDELLGIMAVSYDKAVLGKDYQLLHKVLVFLSGEFASMAIYDENEHVKHIMQWLQTSPVSELDLLQVNDIKPNAPYAYHPTIGHKIANRQSMFFKPSPKGKWPEVVIICNIKNPKSTIEREVCEQSFLIPELEMEVKVRYLKTYLPQWPLIQQKTTALFLSFKEQH